MPHGEFIDLSVSTDDERPSTQRKAARFDTARDARPEKSHHGNRELANINSAATGAPFKKRRLNHTSGSDDAGFAPVENFGQNRSLVLPEVTAPTVTKSHQWAKAADQWEPEFLVLSPEDRSITSNINVKGTKWQILSSDESEESFPEDIRLSTTHQPKKVSKLSQRTSALLARLENPIMPGKPSSGKSGDQMEKGSHERGSSVDLENEEPGSQKLLKSGENEPSKSIKSKLTDEEKAAKAERESLRAAERVRKAKEKEEALEMKRIMREEKAKQKRTDAALAEVNKSKLDKKVTGPEMIVDLPASIDGQQVDIQIRNFLKNLNIDVSLYQSSMPNMIKWRRKVKSRFNETKGHWEVVEPMVIEDEKYIICLMDAKEFVALASGVPQNDISDVEAHVAKVKSDFEGCKPIYLIEGLNAWMRKNKAMLNRAYRRAVLGETNVGQDPASGISQSSSSRRKEVVHKHVDEDVIEDALLQLQVICGCLVHHTTTTVETAKWVAIFTQQISMIPSRKERMNLDTSFCMESGQIKTGEDKEDTFIKMLQEVVRVTAPVAYGIASDYPSVVSLVNVMRRHGPSSLENIEKCANKNGVRTDRKIGPAISKRLYKCVTRRTCFREDDLGSLQDPFSFISTKETRSDCLEWV